MKIEAIKGWGAYASVVGLSLLGADYAATMNKDIKVGKGSYSEMCRIKRAEEAEEAARRQAWLEIGQKKRYTYELLKLQNSIPGICKFDEDNDNILSPQEVTKYIQQMIIGNETDALSFDKARKVQEEVISILSLHETNNSFWDPYKYRNISETITNFSSAVNKLITTPVKK